MFDHAGKMIFAALHAEAVARLGADHPCASALAAAAESPEPANVRAAEAALRDLTEAERVALMEAAHRALRGNPLAWLALWPGGPARQ